MKIGLMNLEPKIFNSALMQISQYHKEQQDQVEWYSALFHNTYDLIYCSSLFTFTQKPAWLFTDDRVSLGGTGFDPRIELPSYIEKCNYDWSLYPKCKYSIIWFSRGCINNCGFCLVRKKEGYIRSVKPKNLNPEGLFIKIMDNNFFANKNWKKAIKQLKEWDQPADFQGVDIRILNDEMIQALLEIPIYKNKTIHIAWDQPQQDLRVKLEWIIDLIPYYKLTCYVLVGYNSTIEQDLFRINFLKSIRLAPYVMVYNHRRDSEILNHLQRWVNNKWIFNKSSFTEYLDKKQYRGDLFNG